MGQGQSGNVPQAVTYLPWQAAVTACLPEHAETWSKALTRFELAVPRTPSTKLTPEQVDEVISEKPVAWDDIFYLLAVGRGTKEGLPKESVPSLLAILDGFKPSSRYLAEAAMLALARLYSNSNDAMISNRIAELWENHEISNVRDCALLALHFIGHADTLEYCKAMSNVDKVTDEDPIWRFCGKVSLKPPNPIDWQTFDESVSMQRPMAERVFLLLRLKNASTASIGKEVRQVFGNLCEIVLLNVVDDRLVLQVALAAVIAHSDYLKSKPFLLEGILQATRDIRQMNAFREARAAAGKVLEHFQDSFTRVFSLFPGKVETLKCEDLQKALLSKFPEFNSLTRSPLEVLEKVSQGDFQQVLQEIKDHNAHYELSFAKSKIYEVVMIYYFAIHMQEMPRRLLEPLLYSNNMFERYIALVHIGVRGIMSHQNAVEYILEHDSISDVRGCAEAVAGQLNEIHQKLSSSNTQSNKVLATTSSRSITALPTSDMNDLLKRERELLAMDCIASNNSKDDVQKWLKDHGF
jgi:hypothetical protein